MPALREFHERGLGNPRGNTINLNHRAIFVVYALDGKYGAANGGQRVFDGPLRESWIEPDLVPSPEGRVGVCVVAGKPLATQLGVLAAISVAMTIGVYGLVAGIVKLDDLGAVLATRPTAIARSLGRGILAAAPWLMRALAMQ